MHGVNCFSMFLTSYSFSTEMDFNLNIAPLLDHLCVSSELLRNLKRVIFEVTKKKGVYFKGNQEIYLVSTNIHSVF